MFSTLQHKLEAWLILTSLSALHRTLGGTVAGKELIGAGKRPEVTEESEKDHREILRWMKADQLAMKESGWAALLCAICSHFPNVRQQMEAHRVEPVP